MAVAAVVGEAFDGPAAAGAEDTTVSRGGYIAQHVAMCVQCHSPRTPDGRLLQTELFKGGPIPVESPWPHEPWASRAPSIRNFAGYSEAEAVKLLTTGKTRRGDMPMAPMPPFRMNEADAKAVYAYLKSVK